MARALVALSLVLAAATLVTSTAHAQQPPAAPETSRAVVSPSEGPLLLWPTTPPADALDHPMLRRGHDMGLISAGIIGLSLGMIVGVVIASLDLAFGNCETRGGRGFGTVHVQCGTAPFSLVPLAGSVVVGTVGLDGSVGVASIIAGSLAAAPQIAGLIALLVGMHGYTEDLVGDVRVRLDPVVSGSQLGALLTVHL